MPTYIVGDIHITDPAAYQAHVPRALATIARFGGRVFAAWPVGPRESLNLFRRRQPGGPSTNGASEMGLAVRPSGQCIALVSREAMPSARPTRRRPGFPSSNGRPPRPIRRNIGANDRE